MAANITNNLQHVREQIRKNPCQPLETLKRPRQGFQLKQPTHPVRITFAQIRQKVAAASARPVNVVPPPPTVQSGMTFAATPREPSFPSHPPAVTPQATDIPRSLPGNTNYISNYQQQANTQSLDLIPRATGNQGSAFSTGQERAPQQNSYSSTHHYATSVAYSSTNNGSRPSNASTGMSHLDDLLDDIDDEAFENIDVDHILSQQQQMSRNARPTSFQSSSSAEIRPVSSGFNAEPTSFGSSNTNGNQFDYGTGGYDDPGYSGFNNSFDAASGMMAPTDGSIPQCTGHQRPCILLTARSEANSGRQFYKCSLQGADQCDYFEWADGGTSNNAPNAAGAYGNSFAAGETKDLQRECQLKFGHRNFRPGQKGIIENAIAGRDVFVLMPTGGGKSLCYQCPAWCCPGLAVVISPLLSLIQDQVLSMNKLGVESVFLSSSQDYQTEQVDITRRLKEVVAHGGVKLLYITPEKLNNSPMLQGLLSRLHSKGLISRFIVDEAHCLRFVSVPMSNVSHRSMFVCKVTGGMIVSLACWTYYIQLTIVRKQCIVRPDYNKLGMLRRDFPGVPLMALTATANGKVVNDAIRALGMTNEYRYVSSFNRPNLRYQVLKKDGKTIEAIAEYVSKRSNDSGVIYCLSRKDCEKLSEQLSSKVRGASVSFYHAELDTHERERRHREWSHGRISVLCATIAFGMGIDKPDVRYVIHYSMPKSITHYYQESGRAGRDSENADCILYYSYKDKKILENMIIKSSNDPHGNATRRKIDQLYTCVRYCEDEFRCRRTMQLEFFGENFDASKCNKTCDNCRAGRIPDRRDLTSVAQEILRLMESASSKKRITLMQLTDLYRGSKSQSATKNLDTGRLVGYGKGSKWKKFELDKIMHAMICDHILVETAIQNQSGYSIDYVEASENAPKVLHGQHKLYVNFPSAEKKGKENKDKQKKKRKAPSTLTSKLPTARVNAGTGSASVPMELDDSDDDDNATTVNNRGDDASGRPILPPRKATELAKRIKELAEAWAREEAMLGTKSVYYWNIIPNHAMKVIASAVPTTMDELREVGVLGVEILKNYGERLVRVVAAYVEREELTSLVETAKASKRPRVDTAPEPNKPATLNTKTDGVLGNDASSSKYFG